MIIRRLIVPLSLAVATLHAGHAFAQGTLPAPLPGHAEAPAGGYSDACTEGFAPLREEAAERGKLIKAASERHAPPDEACRLIGSFVQSEIKMIRYVEANSAQCGIPPQIAEQLKTGHKDTEAMLQKVCAVAQQAQRRGPAEPVGPTGDFPPYNNR